MKSLPLAQQFRRSTGEFLNKQDEADLNQTQQDERIKMLAAYPGRHQGNAARQDLANATLNIIALLSVLQPDHNSLPLQRLNSAPPVNPALLNAAEAGNSIGAQIKSVTPYTLLSELPKPVLDKQQKNSLSLPEANSQSLSRARRSIALSPALSSVTSSTLTPAPNNKYSAPEISDILHRVQNHLLDKFLDTHRQTFAIRSSFERVNNLVEYIKENEEENIDKVARILLSASASYGENKEEYLSKGQKRAIIVEYLNKAILGKSLDSWCLQQAHLMRQKDNALYNHGNLQHRLTRLLNDSSKPEMLSAQARIFYQNASLKKILPTLMLTPDSQDREDLEKMMVNDPRWAFIHAGAMLLSSSDTEFISLPLKQLEEIGITLDVLLHQGAVPQEYIEFFKIPALFDYINYHQSTTEDILYDTDKLTQIFKYFFDNTTDWVKSNNPFALLPDLVSAWKTRSELASDMLTRNGISEELLTHYLNSHNEIKLPVKEGYERIPLPNIDNVFYNQNEKIEITTNKADKLLLPLVFDSLSNEDQLFIQKAKVERVTAAFDARDEIRNVPLPPSARRGIDAAGALVYHVPDRIDLLRCTNGKTEKIYALKTIRSGEYILERVDRKRDAILNLLDDGFTPTVDKDYKLKITSPITLKERNELPTVIIDALANLHSKKLRSDLDKRGYEKTTKEKVGDFFLGLIPFYTCISESIKGNVDKALPSCLMDILGLVPVAGLAARTTFRFGAALSSATIGALTYGLREATLNAMIRQSGNKLVSQFPLIAKEISPQVMRNLGVAFLRSVDPGVELLSRAGIKGVTALKAIARASKKDKSLALLAPSLDKIPLPETKIQSYQASSISSSQNDKLLDVVNIGTVDGKPLWVQLNRETGEFFEQKYRLDPEGKLGPIQSPLSEELERLKILSAKLGLKLMNPGEPQASGSRDMSGTQLALPAYNRLPPVAGNSEKFNRVRKVSDIQYPVARPGIVNTQIQRLSHFIPVHPLFTIEPEYVNQLFMHFNNEVLGPHPWRAYAGFALNVPPAIAWAQQKVRTNLYKSKRTLEKAHQLMTSINYSSIMDHRVGKYLSGMLGTDRVEVIAEASRRLTQTILKCKKLLKASEEVDFSNIITISTDLIKSPYDPNKYMSVLSDEEIYHMPFGATSIPDAEGRIMIYVDSFLGQHDVLDKNNLSVSSKTKLTMAETFNHELSHSAAGTLDIFKVYVATKRQKLNGMDLRTSFIKRLYFKEMGDRLPSIFDGNDIYLFFNNLKAYQGITTPITEASMVRAIMSDKMLFANLMLSDADVVSRTITALVDKRQFNAIYMKKREVSNASESSESDTDITEVLDISDKFITLLLAQVMDGIIKQDDPLTIPEENYQPPQKIKNIKINGVTMEVQIYGNTEDENLLFPEINEVIPANKPLNAKKYKKAFSTLLPQQKKALKIWAAKGLHHTANYNDDTPGLPGGIYPAINKKLIKGATLNRKELKIIQNIMSAISSKKIPPAPGNYVRASCYINGKHNPWLEDAIEIGDYLTMSPAFMSVSSDPSQLLPTIVDSANIDNRIDSLLFFKIENATNALPLLSVVPAKSPLKDDFIYPPDALFKVKSLVYATPVSSEALYANKEMYLPTRVGVVLTEVDEEQAKTVVMAKNIFTGENEVLK
ncbi:hypothetical protein [Vagococcus sp. WN89Y]|uniref:hypothetical protein n=1 Tax=Vagococcus sp. WN89Y TaxID=3457258 RepID=UPI003FCE9C63